MAFAITREMAENLCKAEKFKTICPRCGGKMSQYPALSRYADIDICSDCGTQEAFESLQGVMVRTDFKDWKLGRD